MNSTDWSRADIVLRCPLCSAALREADGALRCERGHAFDLAREGYVNLLAHGRSAPRLAGDSLEMLRARRAFLERGHFEPLADTISAAVARHLISPAPAAADAATGLYEADGGATETGEACLAPTATAAKAGARAAQGRRAGPTPPRQRDAASASPGMLDAGCGEGYYLGHLAAHLQTHGVAATLFGMDIAKDAARMAARRYPAVRFVVADVNAPLPFADASMAAVLDIFAPRNPAEFARVLAPAGLLLVVLPTPAHLAELRAVVPLLGIEPRKLERAAERLSGAFTLSDTTTLEYPLVLSGADATILVRMSPSARHVTPAAVATLASRERILVTAGFELLAFIRRA